MKLGKLNLTLMSFLLISVILFGCTGGSSSPPSTYSLPKTTISSSPTTTSRIMEMLEVVPDLPEVRSELWFIDFASLRKTYGIDLSKYKAKDGNPLEQGENDYIPDLFAGFELTGIPGDIPFISGMGPVRLYADLSPIRTKNIGFGPLDIERSIVAGEPPNQFEAIKGVFDLTAIRRAIDKYEEAKQPRLLTYKNVTVYDWGSEIRLSWRLSPPIFDQLGRGRKLAVQQYDIFGSTLMEYVQMMLDASHGQLTSLADNPQFRDMANYLAEMGAISALLTDFVQKPDNYLKLESPIAERFIKASQSEPVLGPYTAFATGFGKDEKGPFMTLVLIYDQPEQANHDVGVLRQRFAVGQTSKNTPWRELIDSSEVWADGRALCAKLRGHIVLIWARFSYSYARGYLDYEPLLIRGG